MVATWGESSRAGPTRSMWSDLLRRVRWGNVAFALAALVVAGGVISAALDPAPPPRLPSDRAAPLIAGEARPRMAATPAGHAKRTARKAEHRARPRRGTRTRKRSRTLPARAQRRVAPRTLKGTPARATATAAPVRPAVPAPRPST